MYIAKNLCVLCLLCVGLVPVAWGQQGMRSGPPIVNQAGYNLGEAKRVVVPGAADGTPFQVRQLHPPAPGTVVRRLGDVVYEGTLKGYVGDFSALDPAGATGEYVVTVSGHGQSHPFWIADHLMESLSSRLAYQFFMDVRGGTELDKFDAAAVAGGGPSRDGAAYTLETPFEVLLYASNPALFDRWTQEMVPMEVPDLVNLILWHAEFAYAYRAYNGPTGHRPYMIGYENEPLQTYDYQNTLDHLAAALAAYHAFLKPYMPEEAYRRYRSTALGLWESYDRHKVVRYWVKSNKWIDEGWQEFNEMGNALGQSVLRNLFMYLAEQHEPDGDPERFLGYARDAARDLITAWDFGNPRHTWLHRNAEHIGPQALAFFLMVAPDEAPTGTREKLEAWRNYILSRTDNLWHYRTHSDTEWAHPQSKEVGTVAGLGGAMFAAAHVLQDARLRAIGWSQVNFVFGLNPVGAHLSNKSLDRQKLGGYWPGVERGWPDAYPAGAGNLGQVRGALDGSPLDHAFPYKPEAYAGEDALKYYATEGWALTNRAWMSTVTFSTIGSHTLEVPHQAMPGDSLQVVLRAALNTFWDTKDTGWVEGSIFRDDQKVFSGRIPVTETGPNTGRFTATMIVGSEALPAQSGDRIRFSYGYLGFEKVAEVTIK